MKKTFIVLLFGLWTSYWLVGSRPLGTDSFVSVVVLTFVSYDSRFGKSCPCENQALTRLYVRRFSHIFELWELRSVRIGIAVPVPFGTGVSYQ